MLVMYKNMKYFLVLTIVVAFIEFSNGFACTQNYCQLVRCANAVCKDNEIFVEKGGTCGCCDACYKKLYERERCRPLTEGGGAFLAKCVKGLICGKDGVCEAV